MSRRLFITFEDYSGVILAAARGDNTVARKRTVRPDLIRVRNWERQERTQEEIAREYNLPLEKYKLWRKLNSQYDKFF